MEGRTEKIRQTAKRLLSEGTVEVVIGYKAGTIPLKTQPFFARTPEEADLLVWNSNCRINLANFLPRLNKKAAVTAKGCDARNIVNHILENQFKREDVYIIGVPCEGMIDPTHAPIPEGAEVREAVEKDGKITVSGKDFSVTFAREDALRQNCSVCVHRNPAVYDELAADEVKEQEGIDRYADIRELLSKSDAERWAYYQDLISTCIRCYACRDACPLCYCHCCFVDESMPQWLGKGQDPIDTLTYHLLRAFHCAGRCTDCGACESACPMDIKVRQFTRLLEKNVSERYGFEAGLSLDKVPPLTLYRPDDPQEFIK